MNKQEYYMPEFSLRIAHNVENSRDYIFWMNPVFFAYVSCLEAIGWNKLIKSITLILHENDLKGERFKIFGDKEIIGLKVFFDFASFLQKKEKERKTDLLQMFYTSFKYLNTELSMNVEETVFQESINKTIENNFRWYGNLTSIIISPNKKRKIKFEFEYDYDIKLIVIQIKYLNPKQSSFKILSCLPVPYYLNSIIGKITWISNEQINVVPKGKFPSTKLLIDLEKEQIEIDGDYKEYGIVNYKI